MIVHLLLHSADLQRPLHQLQQGAWLATGLGWPQLCPQGLEKLLRQPRQEAWHATGSGRLPLYVQFVL